MQVGFEVFEHTADVGIRAVGATWPELLANAARGMFSLIADAHRIRPDQARAIDVTAENREDLLMAWLKRLLCLFDVEGLLLCEFVILEADETHVRAQVFGEPLDPERHEPDMEVKAVTWHGFHVRHHDDAWMAEIIFDI